MSTAALPLPMFPLGTVLVPGVPLSLRAFEPRYLRLVEDCLRTDRRFGVVLIARGSEVGGGDERVDVGTIARIADALRAPDGTWQLVSTGEARLRVATWLPDDPYPVALVEELPDTRLPIEALDVLATAERVVRRCLGLASELGDPVVAATVQLDGDPHVAAWQLAGIAPLADVDRQALLALDDPVERLRRLTAFAEHTAEVLAYRLAGGR